jgi:hypothetical protein
MKWTKELLDKRKQTSLKRYGKNNYVETDEFNSKCKETLIKKYGSVKNAYQKRETAGRITKLKRYGSLTYHNVEQFKETLLKKHEDFERINNCTHYKKLIEQFGQGWFALNLPIIYRGRYRYISNEYLQQIKDYVSINHNVKSVSDSERELRKFIKSCTKCKLKYNVIGLIEDDEQKYELDIYIPDLNLAFEFNGNYWHSSLLKDKYYHQQKTKLCYSAGIQLIHIYEYDWCNNKETIKDNIVKLLNGEDCSYCNWIKLSDYNKYILSEPILYEWKNGNRTFIIYNEGKFIKITE